MSPLHGCTCADQFLCEQLRIAAPKLVEKTGGLDKEPIRAKAEKNKDVAFYAGQMESARFFIHTLLPATYGKMDAILEADTSVEDILEISFGSK